ncbi:hypothetical protein P8452_59345 [Trifolium repens]|jgi:hypothetical protein|nr:hypothetical protein P8452_59345 [Trifolium repens]
MSFLSPHHPLSRSIFGGLLLRLSSLVISLCGSFGRRRTLFPHSDEVIVYVMVQFIFVLESGGWLLSWWLKEVVYMMEVRRWVWLFQGCVCCCWWRVVVDGYVDFTLQLVLTLWCGGGLFLGLRGGCDCRICGFLSTGCLDLEVLWWWWIVGVVGWRWSSRFGFYVC